MIILPEDKTIISILTAEDAGHVLMALVSDEENPELSAQAKIVYTVIIERNKRISEKNHKRAKWAVRRKTTRTHKNKQNKQTQKKQAKQATVPIP